MPGRLFRHGQHFDFMLSWKGYEADNKEREVLVDVLRSEIKASRVLEEIIYNSRSSHRERFTMLHRRMELGE